MDEIKESLDRQIQTEIDALATTTGDEKKEKVEQLKTLYELRLEEMRVNNQHDVDTYARNFKLGLEVAGLLLANGISLYSVIKCLHFEETGVIKLNVTKRILGWCKPSKLVKMFKF